MPAPTFDAHLNLAVSSIAVAPSPPTSGTSITVGSGEGARFPAVPFNATIGQPAALLTPLNAEIVRVTAKSGDVFTITRAQEGTAARSIAVGDLIGATITSKVITDIEGAFTGVARTDLPNTYTQVQTIQAAGAPSLYFYDTSQVPNSRVFQLADYSQTFLIQAMNDALNAVTSTPLTLTRAGDAQIWRDVYEKQRTTPLGHWIDVPFNAANFTANVGSWTVSSGNVLSYAYALIGKTLLLIFDVINTSVSGTPGWLGVAVPGGVTLAGGQQETRCAEVLDGGTISGTPFVRGDGTSVLKIYKDPAGAAWTNGSGNTVISFSAALRLA